MNILFLHRTFPGQFKYIAPILAADPKNVVMFMTADGRFEAPGINKLVYSIKQDDPNSYHPYLKEYETFLAHGKACAEILIAMKNQGVKPDIIYGHSWGPTMFVKDIFPDVPLAIYFEWFCNAEGAAIGFDGNVPNQEYREKIRTNNAQVIMDLAACDLAITPTYWQKAQFPKEFHNKINVIHDGVDINTCKPDDNAEFIVPDSNIKLTKNDEIITYATRGMEPFRGFPEFMQAVEILQKKRPNAHFVIGGQDAVYYGEPLKSGTYKELMLNKLNLDLSRIHFVGALNFNDYVKLLQVSSVHVYSTVPFILSWSILEAMAMECTVVASNTAPVLEVMKDNYNGLLFDFYNVNQMVEKIEYALNNPNKMKEIKSNARKTVVDNYDLQKLLPAHVCLLYDLIKK